MSRISLVSLLFFVFCLPYRFSRADEKTESPDADIKKLEARFSGMVKPFLKSYCLSCHDASKSEGKLDLSGFASVEQVSKQFAVWDIVLQRLESSEMPPESAEQHPDKQQRDDIVQWIRDLRDYEASRNTGDPGPVLARRLSNAEFDNSIRDLTGTDIRPTREFPVDPANTAGFDNSGESLSMSPALLKKYLSATRLVADHMLLQPHGFTFAPHPVVTETDRDKFCVERIVDFYRRHDVEYADYFLAAWQYRHRHELGFPNASLTDFSNPDDASAGQSEAGSKKLSPRYLTRIWEALNAEVASGPLFDVQQKWNALPAVTADRTKVKEACTELSDMVWDLRYELMPDVEKLNVSGISQGSQPLVLWWNRKKASHRMQYTGEGSDPDLDHARRLFCQTFPAGFSVSSRGHYSNPDLGSGVRLLSAGFHLMQGYFRDDAPLYELVLSDAEQKEIDRLWNELNFATLAPIRQYKDFLFFERAEPPQFAGGPEFDFARPENKDVTSESMLMRMLEVYQERATEKKAGEDALQAIQTYFEEMNRTIRWIESAQETSEPLHLQSLLQLTERAWRRPLPDSEKDELLAFYRTLRDDQNLSHEEAMRDSVASVLMSPWFSYRFDLADHSVPANNRTESPAAGQSDYSIEPLNDYALASRLSYFLWCSMPDEELMQAARSGTLHDQKILTAQAQRMLADPKIRGMATEFGGNWLDFRRFEEHNSVDRERFPEFTSELRSAMFEEPVRFLVELAQNNGSVLDCLHGRHTFVNPLLARHYGIEMDWTSIPGYAESVTTTPWIRISDADRYGRGGLLPMSVFLTKNSPGLRTSPVKRGYWVIRRLLGEHIPAPPPNVPELPKDESQFGDATLAQLLARHRDHAACAGCHQRFDSAGLVFEGYGPVGERRELDLGNRPVQTEAEFPSGTSGKGLEGLKKYLIEDRQQDFVDNLCRKFLSFALGRSLLLSDESLIKTMRNQLIRNDYRFHSLVETVVCSQQFLCRRTEPEPANGQ